MAEKKVVYYCDLYEKPTVGKRAFVQPINHPSKEVSNDCYAHTSPVVHVTEDLAGDVIEFETLNTIYVKE